jgi:hypothetical protein
MVPCCPCIALGIARPVFGFCELRLNDHKLPQGPLGHGDRVIGPLFRHLRPLAQHRDRRFRCAGDRIGRDKRAAVPVVVRLPAPLAVRGRIRGNGCRAEFW